MRDTIIVSNVSCSIICAKWALDLGFNQFRQILYLVGGLIFGPVMLLILYIFLVTKAKKEGLTGGKIV